MSPIINALNFTYNLIHKCSLSIYLESAISQGIGGNKRENKTEHVPMGLVPEEKIDCKQENK